MSIGAPKLIYLLAAAASGPSNSASEAVVDSYVAAANALQSGKLLHWTGSLVQSAVNGTDTLRIRCRIGPTTLTGTAVADSTAVTGAANNTFVWSLWAHAVSSSVLTVWGTYSVLGVVGTATGRIAYTSVTSLDYTAALRFEVTALFSAASASNACALQSHSLVEWR